MAAYATIFSGQSADGSSSAIDWTKGQVITVSAYGTFGGGTLTIEASHDGTNWVAIDGLSFTAAGVKSANLPSNTQVRGTLAGATTPSLNAVIL